MSTPISVQGYKKLERELEALKKERPAVIQAIKDATDEVQKAFYAVSEKLYKNAAPQDGCAGDCGNCGDDGVVDADYQTVD